ncbi:hypothetical protein BT96DRAFT_928217 [Gymnopus androsaceus JB14]|uniref:Uncharacterized protein n=1 Tax=Gymnopus androsaceus JB14 TaxID=1447944 RepID=A0A6A4GL62_9AGAR|nr:hypothetical protein BT96DRAFT_928217 [Gymnopus androsaceus JB14]
MTSRQLKIAQKSVPKPVAELVDEGWKHPAELIYSTGHYWSDKKLFYYCITNTLSLSAFSPNNSGLCSVSDGRKTIAISEKYRVPIIFATHWQWAKLKSLLAAGEAERKRRWAEEKYEVLHIARVWKILTDEGPSIESWSSNVFKQNWRCHTLDRVLTRFKMGCFSSESSRVENFWDEYQETEYSKEVLDFDWRDWLSEPRDGVALNESQFNSGLDPESLMRGLKEKDGEWLWETPENPLPEPIWTSAWSLRPAAANFFTRKAQAASKSNTNTPTNGNSPSKRRKSLASASASASVRAGSSQTPPRARRAQNFASASLVKSDSSVASSSSSLSPSPHPTSSAPPGPSKLAQSSLAASNPPAIPPKSEESASTTSTPVPIATAAAILISRKPQPKPWPIPSESISPPTNSSDHNIKSPPSPDGATNADKQQATKNGSSLKTLQENASPESPAPAVVPPQKARVKFPNFTRRSVPGPDSISSALQNSKNYDIKTTTTNGAANLKSTEPSSVAVKPIPDATTNGDRSSSGPSSAQTALAAAAKQMSPATPSNGAGSGISQSASIVKQISGATPTVAGPSCTETVNQGSSSTRIPTPAPTPTPSLDRFPPSPAVSATGSDTASSSSMSISMPKRKMDMDRNEGIDSNLSRSRVHSPITPPPTFVIPANANGIGSGSGMVPPQQQQIVKPVLRLSTPVPAPAPVSQPSTSTSHTSGPSDLHPRPGPATPTSPIYTKSIPPSDINSNVPAAAATTSNISTGSTSMGTGTKRPGSPLEKPGPSKIPSSSLPPRTISEPYTHTEIPGLGNFPSSSSASASPDYCSMALPNLNVNNQNYAASTSGLPTPFTAGASTSSFALSQAHGHPGNSSSGSTPSPAPSRSQSQSQKIHRAPPMPLGHLIDVRNITNDSIAAKSEEDGDGDSDSLLFLGSGSGSNSAGSRLTFHPLGHLLGD